MTMRPKAPQHKTIEWRARAAKKNGIVPEYFEVFPTKVIIVCGQCWTEFSRNLIPNCDEPVFVCPNQKCRARNWIPLRYEKF